MRDDGGRGQKLRDVIYGRLLTESWNLDLLLSETLQQQQEEMFNPANLVPLSSPVALASATTTQIQTQMRPTYPVLERVQQMQNIPDTLPQQQQQPQQLPDEYDADGVDDEEEEDDVEHVTPAVPAVTVAKIMKPRKPKSPRKKKDPNAPSAPMSAYAFFFRETQVKLKFPIPPLLEKTVRLSFPWIKSYLPILWSNAVEKVVSPVFFLCRGLDAVLARSQSL